MNKLSKINKALIIAIILIMIIASMIIFIPSVAVAEEGERPLDSYEMQFVLN